MAADANIFQQYMQPVKSVMDYRNEMDKQEQNSLTLAAARRQNTTAAEAAQQQADDRNALQRIASSWSADTSPDQRIASLRNSGRPALMTQADALETQWLGRQKTTADVSKTNNDVLKERMAMSRQGLEGIQTPEQFMQWHESNHKDSVIGPYLAERGITADQSRARIAQALQTPGGFEQLLRESKIGMEKSMENQFNTQNYGGGQRVIASPKYGNGPANVVPGSEVANTATPEALLTDQRTRSEGAANRGVTVRGQNMTDARAKEAHGAAKVPAGYRAKPDGSLEAIPGGPADKGSMASEGERKAATLLQRLEFSSKQLDEARKDKPSATKPSVFTNGLEAIGMDSAANSLQSSERQRIEGAQLDMLDAALTLGTGAAYTREQLKGYAKSYFPQVGDGDKAIKDKDARLKNVIEAAKIAAGRAGKSVNTGGATGDFGGKVVDFGSLK